MPRSRIPSSASNADTIMRLQTAAASDRAAGLNQTHSARVLVVCYSRKGENYAPGGTEVLEIGHTAKMAQLISALTGGASSFWDIRFGGENCRRRLIRF
ncbi:MAG: hypothetical protein BHW60_08655 [Sutterella sp. 54_7]|nr:MAG: hypothetical protein BHW60_08655 [Sutterella sp. 54_7]